jgi:DNA invertase Pin-like site-specific DNA recombinase
MRLAFSYTRYSSKAQGDGDSLRRQTEGTIAWCKRHGVQLDTSKSYCDPGRSAYRGKHRENGTALTAFLSEVKRGSIPRGSVLIVESLDRLTREHPLDAVPFLCNLMNSGLTVVTLTPSEVVYERESGLTSLILAVVEVTRSHNESKVKSERVGQAWEAKRRKVRDGQAIFTSHLPAWVEKRGEKLVLNPQRAALVRRMFVWSSQGYGTSRIVRELTEQKIPTWGAARNWSKTRVHKILTSRSVLGELHLTSGGKPEPPIADYYPRVIDEVLWETVRHALKRRKQQPGPIGEKVATLFGGLLRDALSGDPIRVAWQLTGRASRSRKKRRFLVSARYMDGAGPCCSFPHDVFEEAILKLFKEVKARDVMNEKPETESVTLSLSLANKESRLSEIESALAGDAGDVMTFARVAKKLESECADLREKLARARLAEANPRSDTWAEAQTLFDVAKTEEQRLRLRELLRSTIDQILMLVVKRKSHRFAAVQVCFQGGGSRHYLLWYRAGWGDEPEWRATSLTSEFVPAKFDLRDQRYAKSLAKKLETVDVETLVNRIKAGD